MQSTASETRHSQAQIAADTRRFNEFRFQLVKTRLRQACTVVALLFLARSGFTWVEYADWGRMLTALAPGVLALAALASTWWHRFRPWWQQSIAIGVMLYALFYFQSPVINASLEMSMAGAQGPQSGFAAFYWSTSLDAVFIVLIGLLLPQLGAQILMATGLFVFLVQLLTAFRMGVRVDDVGLLAPLVGLATVFPAAALAHALEMAQKHQFIYRSMLDREREKSARLLSNILPRSAIDRLKEDAYPIAESHDLVGVMFADLVGFTAYASNRRPKDIVRVLDRIFSEFDELARRLHIEKIKTIGDCYMGCTGAGNAQGTPPKQLAIAAIEMLQALEATNLELDQQLQLRIGISIGPAVAGVIGQKKFAYDLWGPTVNMASRMESTGEPGRIQVSEPAKRELDPWFNFSAPRQVSAKGLGEVPAYWLLGAKADARQTPDAVPGDASPAEIMEPPLAAKPASAAVAAEAARRIAQTPSSLPLAETTLDLSQSWEEAVAAESVSAAPEPVPEFITPDFLDPDPEPEPPELPRAETTDRWGEVPGAGPLPATDEPQYFDGTEEIAPSVSGNGRNPPKKPRERAARAETTSSGSSGEDDFPEIQIDIDHLGR